MSKKSQKFNEDHPNVLLGHEVKINNIVLVNSMRKLDEDARKEFALGDLSVESCIKIICLAQPALTYDSLYNEAIEDMNVCAKILQLVSSSVKTKN